MIHSLSIPIKSLNKCQNVTPIKTDTSHAQISSKKTQILCMIFTQKAKE